nr:hypothetical protein CFP56_14414 [Quercus suber]
MFCFEAFLANMEKIALQEIKYRVRERGIEYKDWEKKGICLEEDTASGSGKNGENTEEATSAQAAPVVVTTPMETEDVGEGINADVSMQLMVGLNSKLMPDDWQDVHVGRDCDFNCVNQFEAAQGSFQDLVAKVLSKPRTREVFSTAVWFVWAHRNKSRLNEKTLPLNGIRDAVGNFLQLFRSCHEPPVSNKMMRRHKWTPLNPGDYKVNFHGAMFNKSDDAGAGIVVRDSRGLVVGQWRLWSV